MLWVKGSGTDLATIDVAGFPLLRLDELLPLRARDAMDDASMVEYLLRTAVRPDQPRPSIETLLHAFIPADHVDHTHPDAVIALTSTPNGRRLAEEVFGDEVAWLDYERPGFAMSRRVAALLEGAPSARAVLLERHGLVTWGETSEECYRATIEFVTRAADAIATAGSGRFGLGGQAVTELRDITADSLLAESLPALRGALLHDADGVVLEIDRSPEAIAFASSARAPEVSQVGAPCPDHLIHTKHKPLVVSFAPDPSMTRARRSVPSTVSTGTRSGTAGTTRETSTTRRVGSRSIPPAPSHRRPRRRDRHERWRCRARTPVPRPLSPGDRGPGHRRGARRIPIALGGRGVRDRVLAPRALQARAGTPAGELAGRVAVITGGGSGIGRAAARKLATLGAHVVVGDLYAERAQEVADEIQAAHGARRALAVEVDVTREDAVQEMARRTVLAYGGLDILVASAGLATSAPVTETTLEDWERNFAVLARGYFLAAREAFRILQAQRVGGSIVFVASKNALVAGANAAAYSSAKAASLHLARCLAEEGGPDGIRVNTVNPDAVIQGSSIWSSEWMAERASTYGVSAEGLEEFYRGRTKLGVSVYPEDVAEAIAFFAGPRSAKSTGNILNVDGGVSAAYPR